VKILNFKFRRPKIRGFGETRLSATGSLLSYGVVAFTSPVMYYPYIEALHI